MPNAEACCFLPIPPGFVVKSSAGWEKRSLPALHGVAESENRRRAPTAVTLLSYCIRRDEALCRYLRRSLV